jgi:hypothetical protein
LHDALDLTRRNAMTITTYYATHRLGRSNAEADAIVHFINDLTSDNGDNRSWDAMRAQLNALTDSETRQRLNLIIEEEKFELGSED